MPALKQSAYNKLLKEIAQIYTQTHLEAKKALAKVINRGYWEIGKRIVTVEQGNTPRAAYGKNLLTRLSKDLTKELGNGFSTTNLKNMRRFYLTRQKSQPVDQLEWSKHIALLSVEDESKRKAYEQKAVHQKWTRAELVAHLKRRNPAREIKRTTNNKQRTTQPASKLIPKRGQLYIYQLIEVDGILEVDCGFHVTRALDLIGLKKPQKDMRVTSTKTRAGFKFSLFSGTRGDLYTYKAGSLRVIDGDTLSCRIDCGFKTKIRRSLRLRGINAPEIATDAGIASKRFVQRQLKGKKTIIFRSYGVDAHGRYVADVFYTSSEGEEIYLNQQILDHGFAVRY